MSIISEPSPNKYFCVGKRGASFPYCNCRVKQFPSSIKLSSLSTVRTGVGIAAAVTSLPSQSGCLMCPPHRVCARGSEIALNKSHCAHHWLRHSPRATDPKNRAPETVATRRISRLSFSPRPLPFSPSPFSFHQGLVGEKYGSIRVPGEVESAEFEMILDAAVEAGLDTHILEEWYCRDENSVPPAYYLKPKAQMLKNYQNSVSPELQSHSVTLTGGSRCSCPWFLCGMN